MKLGREILEQGDTPIDVTEEVKVEDHLIGLLSKYPMFEGTHRVVMKRNLSTIGTLQPTGWDCLPEYKLEYIKHPEARDTSWFRVLYYKPKIIIWRFSSEIDHENISGRKITAELYRNRRALRLQKEGYQISKGQFPWKGHTVHWVRGQEI